MFMEIPVKNKTEYWENPGKENVHRTLDLIVQRVDSSNIRHVVVPSNTGSTVENLLDKLDESPSDKKINIVCITHQVGFREPGRDEMGPEIRQKLEDRGVKVLTTTHLLAGVDRTLKNEYGGLYPPEIIAESLRMFGQGMKVALEVSVMALDGGLIPHGEEIIAGGGTSRGIDTACVITPEHSHHFFDTKIHEILCKPR